MEIFSNTPHFRPLFLLIVETLLWRLVICDLFVNSQKDGCLWAVFVAYLLRGFFQKRRFGLKNYNSITSFSPMLRNRRSRCLPSVGHLFQDHSRTIMTFCLQNCLQCYEMAFFVGYQVEGCFRPSKFRNLPYVPWQVNSSIVRYFTKGTSVIRSPVITKTGWLKCQWCGASPPPDDSPLLGKSRTNMGDLNLLTQLSTCFVLFCDWRIGTHQFSLHTFVPDFCFSWRWSTFQNILPRKLRCRRFSHTHASFWNLTWVRLQKWLMCCYSTVPHSRRKISG